MTVLFLKCVSEDVTGRTVTEEDYLKSIDELTLYYGYATLSDISQILGTRRQSVYDEMKILLSKGLVNRLDKGEYALTDVGHTEANKFLRKHRIAEILLSEVLGLPWSQVDQEAMGIEHGITEEIASRVCEKYGCQICPHGNPVPDTKGHVREVNDLAYDELKGLTGVKVSRVIFESREILQYLESHRILPGTALPVRNGIPFLREEEQAGEIPTQVHRALRYLRDTG